MKYNVNLVPNLSTNLKGITKLDALNAKRDALMKALFEVHRTIEGLEKTECGITCEGCGSVLATERDFAAHFVVPQQNLVNDFLNLANCPKSSRS